MRRLRAKVQELRAEAGAGTPIGYVFAIAVGTALAAVAYLWSLEDGGPSPWPIVPIVFLAALSGPLLATWRRRRDPADPEEGPRRRQAPPS